MMSVPSFSNSPPTVRACPELRVSRPTLWKSLEPSPIIPEFPPSVMFANERETR